MNIKKQPEYTPYTIESVADHNGGYVFDNCTIYPDRIAFDGRIQELSDVTTLQFLQALYSIYDEYIQEASESFDSEKARTCYDEMHLLEYYEYLVFKVLKEVYNYFPTTEDENELIEEWIGTTLPLPAYNGLTPYLTDRCLQHVRVVNSETNTFKVLY